MNVTLAENTKEKSPLHVGQVKEGE